MKALLVRKLSVAFVAVASVWVLSGPALALEVAAGYDLFESVPGSSPANGTYTDIALPAGFFGSEGGQPSDPFTGRIFLMGQPTGPLGNMPGPFTILAPFDENALLAKHGVLPLPGFGPLGSTDTIVHRLGPATLPLVGSMDTIPIEIVSLSLVSVNPIQVTYDGGGPPSFFDVFVDLNPGPQPVGSMTLTRTGETSGTFDSQLPVTFRVQFTNANPLGPMAVGPVATNLTFTSMDVPFEVLVPEPTTVALLVIGCAAMALRRCQRAR